MESDRPSSLELELVLIHQRIRYALRILGSDREVVYVHCDVLVDIAILSHPDVWLSLTGEETHFCQTVGESFVPALSRCPETVQSFEDNHGVPLTLPKLRSRYDIDLFQGQGFKVRVPGISSPRVELVEFREENK